MSRPFRSALVAVAVSCVVPQLVHGAALSGPVTGGVKGAPFCAPAVDIAARGYVVEEFFLDGTAHGYALKGTAYSPDGQWATQRSDETAPFRTRILVVRPASAEDFNGTVIVHWQNVTAGYELGTATDGEYLRGYAWVGVSAQKVGVDGFPGPDAAGLKQWDEERYGSLNHPGDGFSYDIFTQAGRAVGPERSKSGIDPMGGLPVERLVAAGASQSAARLRTYINGVHPLEGVFHAFIPYIDFGATIPFASDFGQQRSGSRQATLIREDLDVPVLVVNSETETVSYVGARQPDTAKFRFWEVAGTSHVTAPRGQVVPGLESPNWLSYQPVYSAAIRHTHQWLTKGVEPPRMPAIALAAGDTTAIDRDDDGNARGGIRLPDIVVPTASHSGMGKRVEGGNRFAFLYGTAHDFSDERLAELYPTPEAFLTGYEKALDRSVKEGMVLPEDAPVLLETARTWSSRLE